MFVETQTATGAMSNLGQHSAEWAMAEFDFTTGWNEALLKKEALLESIATHLPSEGQAWLRLEREFGTSDDWT